MIFVKRIIVGCAYSGSFDVDKKKYLLSKPSEILGCEVIGLNGIDSHDDYLNLLEEVSRNYDHLVIAGGDGAFSDAINKVDLEKVVLSHLPLGSGNITSYEFNSNHRLFNLFGNMFFKKRYLEHLSKGIVGLDAKLVDLINYNERKCLMLSVGLDALSMKIRDGYKQKGNRGLIGYAKASLSALIEFEKTNAVIEFDSRRVDVENFLSLGVSKLKHYGYGLNVLSKALPDDSNLHCVNFSGFNFSLLAPLFLAAVYKNFLGDYRLAKKIKIDVERKMSIQLDGDYVHCADNFEFDVIEKAMRVI